MAPPKKTPAPVATKKDEEQDLLGEPQAAEGKPESPTAATPTETPVSPNGEGAHVETEGEKAKVAADEEKKLEEERLRDEDLAGVSFPVLLHYVPGSEPYAATVTKVKPDGLRDLVYFRPDGHNLRAYDVPHRGGRQDTGCWELAPWAKLVARAMKENDGRD